MNIYTSDKVMPYVYMCSHKITNEFYIGSRTTKELSLPSHLDLPKYKTSSPFVKSNFDQFNWIILAEFFDWEEAYKFEQKMIYEHWNDPLILNKSCYHNKKMFRTKKSKGTYTLKNKNTGERKQFNKNEYLLLTDEWEHLGCGVATAIDAATGIRLGSIDLNDPRWKTGEIIHTHKNKVNAKNSKTGVNLGLVSKTDPRWKTGEIISHMPRNECIVFDDETHSYLRISLNDDRFVSGKLKGNRFGRAGAIVVDTGEKIDTDVNDPRWETGEIVGCNKGKCKNTIPAVDAITHEKLGRISSTDPRWKSGEIISDSSLKAHLRIGKIAAKDSNGNSLGLIDKMDPRWKTGEIVSINKNQHPTAKCSRTGIKLGQIPKSDPRWATGEIVGIRKILNL
jgi:hypothetical protein